MIDNELLSKKHKFINQVIHKTPQIGKINGLYATSNDTGGITVIEVLEIPTDSKLQLELTGSQGDVMQESMRVAKTVAWNIIPEDEKQRLNIQWKNYGNSGIHIHCPDGSTPKDGPSAGGAITLAIISLITKQPIRNDIALTGEINLKGNITKIGGLLQKLIGAKTAGVSLVLVPEENKEDLDQIINGPNNPVSRKFKVITVKTIWEVLDYCLVNKVSYSRFN